MRKRSGIERVAHAVGWALHRNRRHGPLSGLDKLGMAAYFALLAWMWWMG